MHIERVGFTPIKGGRHVEHPRLAVTADGPVGDRMFALVDPSRRRVLHTVDNPRLLDAISRWEDGILSVEIAGQMHEGSPLVVGDPFEVDYWGRCAVVELVAGPWAAAFSALLGFEVVLTRAVRPGAFVYGAPVTLITTGALLLLGERLGEEVPSDRFRATFVIDTGRSDPEEDWIARELWLGDARIRVTGPVARCAVIDIEPGGGRTRMLRELARYRLGDDGIAFGVQAEIVASGTVHRGDTVIAL